jgi:uncharacterized protein
MEDTIRRVAPAAFAPVRADERIHALDIVRGFALIGIFLMNVEWFTRPIALLGSGVDTSLTGVDHAASWLIYTFVQGKFWTLFSLLFGMGFAVMLGRAETAQRPFVLPYVRRLLALMLFGAAHFTLLWTGDILHNYAVTAALLLLIVTKSWKAWLATLVCLALVGAAMHFYGADPRPMLFTGIVMLFVAVLMVRLNRGTIASYWRIGVLLFSMVFVTQLLMLGFSTAFPDSRHPPTVQEARVQDQEVADNVNAHEREIAEQTRVGTSATYGESVRARTEKFVGDDLPGAARLSALALPMFLIGFWFVRAGVMADWRRHLPLFHRLAAWTLPIGLAMTLYSVWLRASFVPGASDDPVSWLARILFGWAMLPLSLGYFALMMSLIGTRVGERMLSPLRFAGQMALTNYIGATIAGTLYFSGYGLGHWGQVGRAGQVVFVAVVFAVQLMLSMIWLKFFRYGPLEWLWRAITYWTLPPMRRAAA